MNTPSPVENLRIADVRRALANQSEAFRAHAERYRSQTYGNSAVRVACEGLDAAAVYAGTLAAVLRLVAERHPDTGFEAAAMVETAMNASTDWLDDANEDLDDTAL